MKKYILCIILLILTSCEKVPKETSWNFEPFIDNKTFVDGWISYDTEIEFSNGHKIMLKSYGSSGTTYYLRNSFFGVTEYDFDSLTVNLYYTNAYRTEPIHIEQFRVTPPNPTYLYNYHNRDDNRLYEK